MTSAFHSYTPLAGNYTAIMQVLTSSALLQYLELSDVSLKDWKTLNADHRWMIAKDRAISRQVLYALTHGAMEASGMPPINPPAEYVALVIVFCVHPVNWMPACAMCENSPTMHSLVNKDGEVMPQWADTMSRDRLFALCQQHVLAGIFNNGHVHEINRAISAALGELMNPTDIMDGVDAGPGFTDEEKKTGKKNAGKR